MANISSVPAPTYPVKQMKKKKEAGHQHLLAVEAVDDESAEGTDDEGGDDVARQDQPDHVFVGTELGVEIYRQQRGKQVEREEQQEIACHGDAVVAVPELFEGLLFPRESYVFGMFFHTNGENQPANLHKTLR